jgi:3-deoxy-D-arabino-heptulosonate 7-phosphate (DAHP) synthase class II
MSRLRTILAEVAETLAFFLRGAECAGCSECERLRAEVRSLRQDNFTGHVLYNAQRAEAERIARVAQGKRWAS